MKTKIKFQPRVKGLVRIPKHSSIHPNIWYAVEAIMQKEKKSASYVIAEIIGDWLQIDYVTGKSFGQKRA